MGSRTEHGRLRAPQCRPTALEPCKAPPKSAIPLPLTTQADCTTLLAALNGEARPYELIEPDPATDPVYEVAEDEGVYEGVPKSA